MKQGKILVTGATGTVGSEVLRQLTRAGIPARAAVHTQSKAGVLEKEGIETVDLDNDKPETYAPALKGIDKVFFVGFAGPKFAEISENFALKAKEAGVSLLVKLSAYGADFAPEFALAKSHRDSELAIEKSGIPYTFLRPNVFMQNLINFTGESIKKEGKIYLRQDQGKTGFIDVRDIAKAAVVILTKPGHVGKAYILTGPEALTYYQVAEVLTQVTGRTITYLPLTAQQVRDQAKARGVPEFMIEGWVNMTTFGVNNGFARITEDFQKLTGDKPRTLAQFVKDFKDQFSQ